MEKAEFRFYLDPESGESHIARHGVSEAEVDEVFDGSPEIYPARDDAAILIGPTEAGRVLKVIYLPDPEPDAVFVITAYELKGNELKAYRRRRRKKPR